MNCSQCEDIGFVREICPDCSGNGCRFCQGKGEIRFKCDCEDIEEEELDLVPKRDSDDKS